MDKYPQQNVNNLNGWYNRVKSYYSDPLEFEKLYKNKVDDYILRKYPQYYNGKSERNINEIYSFILFFVSFGAYANEQACSTKQFDELSQIENAFAKCKIDMPEAPFTADMNKATYEASNCLVSIAHQIFAKYYTKNKTQVEQDFDNLIKEIYNNSHNLIQKSDIAEKYYNGTMYNTMAIGYAHSQIKNLVKEYINQVKTECQDMSH